MDVANGSANLQELLVLGNGFLELAQVVEKDTCAVIRATLVTRLARSLAREGQDLVILQSFLSGDPVVGVCVAHREPRIVAHDVFLQGGVLFDQPLLADDVLLSLGGVEIDGQLNPLGLVDSKGKIALLL